MCLLSRCYILEYLWCTTSLYNSCTIPTLTTRNAYRSPHWVCCLPLWPLAARHMFSVCGDLSAGAGASVQPSLTEDNGTLAAT